MSNCLFCTAIFQSIGFLSCGQPFLGKEVKVSVTLNKDVAFNSLLFSSIMSNAEAEVSDFLIVVQKSEMFQYLYVLCTSWANTKKHVDKKDGTWNYKVLQALLWKHTVKCLAAISTAVDRLNEDIKRRAKLSSSVYASIVQTGTGVPVWCNYYQIKWDKTKLKTE